MHRLLTAGALALALAAAPAAFAADAPTWVGHWHWNPSLSTATPGEVPPRDVQLVIDSASPAHVQWHLTIIDSAGGRHEQSFTGTGDGKPGTVAGAPPGTTGGITVTATAYDAVYTNSDGSSDRSSCSLSPDGKKMTCRGTDSDGKGHSMPYTDVYDRQ